MSAEPNQYCPARKDRTHCNHWWDGDEGEVTQCCTCKQIGDWMNFSLALDAVKQGQKISRAGWNGKGMYVRKEDGDPRECRPPYLVLNAADGKLYPWVASQADLFAEDWTSEAAP